MKFRSLLIVAACIGAAFILAPLFLRIAPPPIVDNIRVVSDDIYQSIESGKRFPAEVALPYLAQAGALQFVRLLPITDDVRERVQARLGAEDFVDELIPFLLALKGMYVAANDLEVKTFDAYLRATYPPGEALPGMQHSMFSWQQQPAEAAADGANEAGFGLDLQLAAQLLTLYDALYLQTDSAASAMQARLRCDVPVTADNLADTAARARATVRQLLTQLHRQMAPESDFHAALGAILQDPERLETVSLTLVQFIDAMVCKHYRMFTGQLARSEQLQRWLDEQLHSPRGGQLWGYLHQAQSQRRYGVLIAVDGLQGHLVEALATNAAQTPFVREITAAQIAGAARTQDTGLAQSTVFLQHFAQHGFAHPAYLPFFKDLYQRTGPDDALHPDGIAITGISTTPTISVRNLPIIKTGAPVAGDGATGVPNFHFVDRQFELNGIQQGRAYYFFGNDALQLSDLTAQAGMQSLPARLPHLNSYSCAAQYDEAAHAGIDPFLNLALGEAVRDFGEILCMHALGLRAANERTLQGLRAELLALRDRLGVEAAWYNWYQLWSRRAASQRAAQLIARIANLEPQGLPQLLVYYNPWPDHFAHFTGPFADEVLAPSGELARLDYWLGQLDTIYQQAGVSARTLFGMAGDHGLAPVFQLESPVARVFEPMQAAGVPLQMIKISSDEGEGPKLTHVLRPPSMRGFDVVIASTAGGNLMLDLFIDQHSNWDRQPLQSHLRRWQPIAWQDAAKPEHIDLIQALLDGLGNTLEYLVVRLQPSDASGGSIAIHGPGGAGQITRRGERVHYAFSGRELLGLQQLSRFDSFSDADIATHQALYQRCVVQAQESDPQSWCTETQWRLLSAFTSKPDSIVQLAHLYDLDRAGTINLFPADGIAYNSIVPGRHAGESFHEKDAFAGVWGKPLPASDAPQRLRLALGGSIPMAIYEHLTGQPVTPGSKGWGYPSLWNQLYHHDKDRRAQP